VTDSTAAREALATAGAPAGPLHQLGPIWAIRAGRDQLLPLWRRLRAEHDRTGLWPLILGPDLDQDLTETFGRDPDREIARGLAMDVAARLADLRAEYLADLAQEVFDDEDDEEIEMPPRGDAAGLGPHGAEEFVLAERDGWLGVLPAAAGHLVPGLLTWDGGANYAIEPADHVALLRQWNERFGAELVCLSRDVLELQVPRPPTDPAVALAVAEDQYWYCVDIVEQGVETLDALAEIQVRAGRWFFWWD
jgi:hypothetical protein